MAEWQPIETAPRDGTHVWLFWAEDEPQQFVGYFTRLDLPRDHEGYCEFWLYADSVLSDCAEPPEPTHWQPLPDPPEPV